MEVDIKCPHCGQTFKAEQMQLELINAANVSMVMMYKKSELCPACLKRCVAVIAQFDPRALGVAYLPIPEDKNKLIEMAKK